MLGLLIFVGMYGGPLVALVIAWLLIGWKFSLSAAPLAFQNYMNDRNTSVEARAAKAYSDQQYSNPSSYMSRFDKMPGEPNEHYKSRAANLRAREEKEKAGFIAKYVVEHRNDDTRDATIVAKRTGKKCIKRGPFAYFLTPQWNNKVTVAWTPTEVTASKIIVDSGELIAQVAKLQEDVDNALGFKKNNSLELN
jgi:hypothetical protein